MDSERNGKWKRLWLDNRLGAGGTQLSNWRTEKRQNHDFVP